MDLDIFFERVKVSSGTLHKIDKQYENKQEEIKEALKDILFKEYLIKIDIKNNCIVKGIK